jgi:uncharacterized SAM-binding protein YcdF (DUF218 family)
VAGPGAGTSEMRTLVYLMQPLSVVWLLLGVWVVWRVWKRRWRELAMPGVAWLILMVMTCTPAASVLMARLEGEHEAVRLADLGEGGADAIVCLGGGAEPSMVEPTGLHLKTGADRVGTALALLAKKKAPLLVLGGGGYEEKGVTHSEADRVLLALRDLGVGTEAMLSLGVCTDTRDEALKVAALARERGWKRVLLVTSAYHMRRSAGTFTKAGVPVVAVPCNYVSSVNRVGDLEWLHLPHADAFQVFGAWFHEVAGTWVYRWRGWL